MTPLQALIVDDEPLARSGLRQLLASDPEVRIAGEAANGPAARRQLATLAPDLVFLDVQLPGLDGVSLLSSLPPARRPLVIFTTAYDEYALRAFELHAVDYLLKPFNNARFKEALGRAKALHRSRSGGSIAARVEELFTLLTTRPALPRALPRRLVVKADGDLHFLEYRDIVWIEGQADYLRINAGPQTLLVRETLSRMEARLDPALFCRVHKSAIVGLAHIRRLRSLPYGDHGLELADGTELRIGRKYWEAVGARIEAALG